MKDFCIEHMSFGAIVTNVDFDILLFTKSPFVGLVSVYRVPIHMNTCSEGFNCFLEHAVTTGMLAVAQNQKPQI